MRSAIILAGGFSRRFGEEKGLVALAGKPLIKHVIDRVTDIVDEVVVVVGGRERLNLYSPIVGKQSILVLDIYKQQSPIVGALSGFGKARGTYSILLPCDTPFISKEIIRLLFDLGPRSDAVIPKWPDGRMEPLQAVYNTKATLQAATRVFRRGAMDLRAMVSGLRKVLYISTMALRQLDPELVTFFNVNVPVDLRRAETILREARVFR